MTALIRYESACAALAECKAVDEVKSWADKAAAMQAYGRMAKDRTLEVDAAEIRIRAERRLGELIAAQRAWPGLAKGTRGQKLTRVSGGAVAEPPENDAPTLAQAGINKKLSSRAQKLAAVPVEQFEAELAAKRERDQQDGARVSARLEAAGARELVKRSDKDVPEQIQSAEDDGTHASASELLDGMERDLLAAQHRIAELEKSMVTDGKERVVNLMRQLDHVERRRNDAMEASARLQRRVARYERDLRAVGKAVGELDLDKVVRAVQAFARNHNKQAAAA
jgi:hypothetical protein